MAYELIETVEVGSGGASSIEFTSIPQDGVDLVLKTSLRGTHATTMLAIDPIVNNDTGLNYQAVPLIGNGSSVSTFSSTSRSWLQYAPGSSATANTFGNTTVYLSNYTSSTDKSISVDSVAENNDATANQLIGANKYSTTSPITSLKIIPRDGNLAEHSTASLYKITTA